MRRTASRAIPAGVLTPARASAFGWAASGAGVLLSLAALPALATTLLVLSHLSYVYLYTPLKRRTPLCTLAGAIPGALPAVAGWAATGRPLDTAGVALGAVLFTWQIPHFLAIGWLAREDYARAGCPMLAVVDPTGRLSGEVSFLYAAAMLGSASLVGLASPAGWLYGAVAVAGGAGYAAFAWDFARRPERAPARRLFLASLMVLPLLLLALAADLLLP
jgi:protoheme IX farnesyltransferase